MSWINLTALWKIIVFGLIAGAGLPALFAGGLYTLSLGPNRTRAAAAGAEDADEAVASAAPPTPATSATRRRARGGFPWCHRRPHRRREGER